MKLLIGDFEIHSLKLTAEAPLKNGWLGDEPFILMLSAYFQGRTVGFRDGTFLYDRMLLHICWHYCWCNSSCLSIVFLTNLVFSWSSLGVLLACYQYEWLWSKPFESLTIGKKTRNYCNGGKQSMSHVTVEQESHLLYHQSEKGDVVLHFQQVIMIPSKIEWYLTLYHLMLLEKV